MEFGIYFITGIVSLSISIILFIISLFKLPGKMIISLISTILFIGGIILLGFWIYYDIYLQSSEIINKFKIYTNTNIVDKNICENTSSQFCLTQNEECPSVEEDKKYTDKMEALQKCVEKNNKNYIVIKDNLIYKIYKLKWQRENNPDIILLKNSSNYEIYMQKELYDHFQKNSKKKICIIN